MTRISEIYDAFVTFTSSTFPNRKRLHDSFDIANNVDLILQNGVGLRFDQAEPTLRQVQAQPSFRRTVSIILTNIVEGIDTDISREDDAKKSLLEDQFLIISALKQNSIVEETTNFVGDNGILVVPDDRRSFLMIETILTVEYFKHC